MKIAEIMKIVMLILMASTAHVVICRTLYGNETDQLSLLEFKKAISLDPQQALMSWNDTSHFCSWEGILCSMNTPPRVTSLNLTRRGLVGQISPSLGNLTFLKFLVLSANAFTGEIPQSLGHLQYIESIYLSNNTLGGRIPNLANCSSLKVLNLYRNNLVGDVRTDLPRHLEILVLTRNNLTGTIPSSLANITTLKTFTCAYNNIVGNIPDELAKLSALQDLGLGTNKLVGWIPQALMNLSSLVQINLALNDLSGEVPSNIGNSLPNIETLVLAGNFFHGHVPSSLTNASKLYMIDMSQNNFTGAAPTSIGKLSKLSWLNLELNNLHGANNQDWEFMNSLANCTELQIFSIERNRLEGPVPNSFGNHSTQLQYVYMGLNQLSGSFPSGLENRHNLILLGLANNQFTGVLPDWLGALTSLQILSVSYNIFTGSLLPSLSNLSQLVQLHLDSNNFKGQIPPSLRNLQMLEKLSISKNNLFGTVPEKIYKIPSVMLIDLSFNKLGGQLPIDIGNARQLMHLKLSSNKLSGNIPNTLGNCESLEHIELDWNALNGSIPNSLGSISSLNVLTLSHNNLTGTIPTSLGDIKLLQQLDLSFNYLQGEVPTKGIFKNATAIHIYGNPALCGGAPELNLLACSVKPLNSSKYIKSIVLKVMIPLATMVLLAILVILLLVIRRVKRKRTSTYLHPFDREIPKISYIDLARATYGFSSSNLIGKGRYGSVYQGKLFHDRDVVAIKVFNLETRGAQKSFIAECNSLRNVRHRNLVPILTACSSIDANGNDFKALVYEFMPRGDLYALLYSNRDCEKTSVPNHITMPQRLSIVVDIADALEYLHHNNHETIVHCDLKPSNILLDDNLTAHVGDFGLATFKTNSTSSLAELDSISSVSIKGTIGYVAPECAGGGQVSPASDVYSFGVVLLEIFIRRRPIDDMFNDELSIVKFAEINFPDGVLKIVDPQLLQELELCKDSPTAMEENGAHCLLSVLNVGLCCTKTSPRERISMQDAAAKLHGIRDAYIRDHEEVKKW